jgi:hypothetical protein
MDRCCAEKTRSFDDVKRSLIRHLAIAMIVSTISWFIWALMVSSSQVNMWPAWVSFGCAMPLIPRLIHFVGHFYVESKSCKSFVWHAGIQVYALVVCW